VRHLTTVYVVDDETVIATTLALILRQCGFRALSFTDPLEALNRALFDEPDLLITDVVMPNLSGVELAIRIKEICPNCKILLFSGQAATADLLRNARERGHDFNVLSKPVHPKDLLQGIRKLSETAVPSPSAPMPDDHPISTVPPA
jgi:CheY-like chemotaxis protein